MFSQRQVGVPGDEPQLADECNRHVIPATFVAHAPTLTLRLQADNDGNAVPLL